MMHELLLNAEAVRLVVFGCLLVLFLFLEQLLPRRRASYSKPFRWLNNLGMSVLNSILLKLMVPLLAFGLALKLEASGQGLFNQLQWPVVLEVLLAMVILDLAIYVQHIVFHKVPLLWRLHRVHHSDLDFDTSTGIRFHFIEIILSMLIKMLLVYVLGAAAIAVLLFEILLNATSLFNHSNIKLPARFDHYLRLLLVTPDMHRVHHSIYREETDSNYGFSVSLWDRLFATYCAQPRDGHDEMKIGIELFRTQQDSWMYRLLIQPFRKQ